mmetsp:Transcript_7318/g.15037  ORF Transcript_7318/g.15037 Transcript_7318/m.15037 type:complete len:82 (-) Transcript_7318:1903-2148(-)
MTQRDQKNDEKKKKGYENDLVVDATPAPENESSIPSGHMRFYCDKCRAPYDLPNGTTSWRCPYCSTFNSITPAQCPCCAIM